MICLSFPEKERKMKKRFILLAFMLTFLLSLFSQPHFGFSVERYSKLEISFSVSQYNSSSTSTYLSDYSPPFLNVAPSEYKSWGRQELNFQRDKKWGYGAAVAFFPSPYFGIQVLGRYFLVPFGERSNSYKFHLEYHSIVYDKEMIMNTSGSLKEYYLGLNAIARIWLGRSISLRIYGGGGYHFLKGEASGPGFSKFWLSEKFWIESETYQLTWILDPEKKFGYNAGAELDVPFYQNLSFYAEFGYFFCPETSFTLTYKEDASISVAQNIELIKQYLPLKELTVKPSFSAINIGFKFKF